MVRFPPPPPFTLPYQTMAEDGGAPPIKVQVREVAGPLAGETAA